MQSHGNAAGAIGVTPTQFDTRQFTQLPSVDEINHMMRRLSTLREDIKFNPSVHAVANRSPFTLGV